MSTTNHITPEEAKAKREELNAEQREDFNNYEAAWIEGLRYVKDQAEALERNLEMIEGSTEEVFSEYEGSIDEALSEVEEEWRNAEERYFCEPEEYEGTIEDSEFEGIWEEINDNTSGEDKVLKKFEAVYDLAEEIQEGSARASHSDHPISSTEEHLNIIVYGKGAAEGHDASELDYDLGLMQTGAKVELLNRHIAQYVAENEVPEEIIVDPEMPEVPEAPDFPDIPAQGVPEELRQKLNNLRDSYERSMRSAEQSFSDAADSISGVADRIEDRNDSISDLKDETGNL